MILKKVEACKENPYTPVIPVGNGGNFFMKRFRLIFQSAIILMVVVTGIRHAFGWSRTTIETYCPFGGLEAALSLFTHKQFTCATGERNLALFFALIVLTLLARKSFCGWVCPVGTVSEWVSALGRKYFPGRRKDSEGRPLHRFELPRSVDRKLRWGRLIMLAVILGLTYKTGELIFRGFDPYYILFSFHGHEVYFWSYIVLGVVFLAIFIFPMAWCRYLCPLGIALEPFSAVGRLRLVRKESSCKHCRACEYRCPYSIDITATEQVKSGECTLCFECVDACPVPGTLDLEIRGTER